MKLPLLTREYPPSIYGGAGVHVVQLVPQLREFIEADVHCMGEPHDGAVAHPESWPAGANAALRVLGVDLFMAAAVVDDTGVLHSHTRYANTGGHPAGLMLDRAHVVTSYSLESYCPWRAEQLGGGYRVSPWVEKTVFETVGAVISASTGMRRDVLASYPDLDPDRVFVVENGIDPDELKPDNGTGVVQGLGIDLDRPTVIFVGRITRQKGLIHPVRTARQLDPETQAALLVGVPDTSEIVAEFDGVFAEPQAKRSAPVIWVPEMLPRASVRQVMTHAMAFACLSVYEPLGIVNLEAMACEIAVVASAAGGVPEVVADGITGLLAPYDLARASDPKFISAFEADFTTKVNRLTGDPAPAEKLGKTGRQRCINESSWEQTTKETITVYEEAITFHGSR